MELSFSPYGMFYGDYRGVEVFPIKGAQYAYWA